MNEKVRQAAAARLLTTYDACLGPPRLASLD